jgi:hypothetical protein
MGTFGNTYWSMRIYIHMAGDSHNVGTILLFQYSLFYEKLGTDL